MTPLRTASRRALRRAAPRLAASLALALSLAPAAATAAVTTPHPGVKLVTQPGRAMLVVDLCAAGVNVRATQYAERKKTAPVWGQSLGLQAAINADFFDFPAATLVNGRARGAGAEWPADKQHFENRLYWQFGPGQASLVFDSKIEPAPGILNIVGGHNLLIHAGKAQGPWGPSNDGPLLNNAYRRTAIGISEDQRTLYLLAVNTTATGATLIQHLVSGAAEAGAPPIHHATNVDGGGSSQLWVAGVGAVVSSTREVANHLGIFADGSTAPGSCVPRYAGAFVEQSFPLASEPPIVLQVGETLAGYFDLRNVGTATWSTATSKLAPIPRDVPSTLADESWPSPHRAAHVETDTAPGEVGRFRLVLRGAEPGEHIHHFGLVEEGVTWFADPTLGGGPKDDLLAVRVLVESATSTAAGGGDGGAASGAGAGGGGGLTSGSGNAAGPGRSPDEEGGCECAAAPGTPRGGGRSALALGLVVALCARRRLTRTTRRSSPRRRRS